MCCCVRVRGQERAAGAAEEAEEAGESGWRPRRPVRGGGQSVERGRSEGLARPRRPVSGVDVWEETVG